jgi:HJR/Mrr/RecB family endonuclease
MGEGKAIMYFIGFIICLIPASASFFLIFLAGGEAIILFIIFIIPAIIFYKKYKSNSPYEQTDNSVKGSFNRPDEQSNEVSKTVITQSVVSESDLQNQFSRFSWRQMEELTGKLFEKKGYDVEVTQGSGDYGIDVWAKKDGMTIGIQVKKWRNDVGFEDVAKTLGSNMSKANKYILISTTSFFTPQAWKHQKQHSTIIELWDTNKFRQELRDNFVNISNNNSAPISTNTDSFDYDKGFNIDEVFDVHKESREWKTRD